MAPSGKLPYAFPLSELTENWVWTPVVAITNERMAAFGKEERAKPKDPNDALWDVWTKQTLQESKRARQTWTYEPDRETRFRIAGSKDPRLQAGDYS